MPLKIYDESIAVLGRALDEAKLGRSDKLEGMRRLDRFARAIEQRLAPHADVDGVIAAERAVSADYGGRTVFDDSPGRSRASSRAATKQQLSLFRD